MSEEKAKATPEQQHEVVSGEVRTVVEHLKANRTTATEALELEKAAHRSVADHAASRAFR